MKNRILMGALVAGAFMFAAGAAAPAMAADNLIVNGDFSSPVGTESSGYGQGDVVEGWELRNAPYQTPGDDVLYIQRVGPYSSGNLAGIMLQSFPTESGKTYTVSFQQFAGMTAENPTAVGDKSFAVVAYDEINAGAAIDFANFVSPPAGTVVNSSYSFTATSAMSGIAFTVSNGAVGFDNITVTEVPEENSPLMIPAVAGGLGIAALGASGIAIQRKKKLADK